MTSKKWGLLGSCLLCFVFLLTVANNTYGQAVTATLNGRILDSSGGAIAKASITATNKDTGVSRTAQSSETGEFNIPALPAGEYTVKVEFAGFRKQAKNITLQVGQTAELDF